MNILAIDSSLDNSYLAFEFEGKIFQKIIKSDENYHSLYLIKKIKEIAALNSIELNKLDAISVNCGPGSFTGIRVSLTIAKVMAGELNLPLIPLNTAEILLNAFNYDYLIMDARRDMFFFATKNNIELILKDKIQEKLNNINLNKILCDKRCSEIFNNCQCYENQDKNLALTMLELAKNKFNNTQDKSIFNHILVEANYIQTPPVF